MNEPVSDMLVSSKNKKGSSRVQQKKMDFYSRHRKNCLDHK